MKILWWVVLALVAVVLIVFAVSNRTMTTIDFWPLPVQAELPLYLLVLGTLIIGFVVGELVGWIGSWRWRREARRGRERIAMLERELEAAQTQHRAAPGSVAVGPR